MDRQKINEQNNQEQLNTEIEILKIMRHPNITQLYQIIQNKNFIYLVMEYVDAGELFDRIV